MGPLKTEISGSVAVIGDVHGQLDKLEAILTRLRKRADYQHRWIVFIGDFVDRGAQSSQTLDCVLRLIEEHPRTTAIAGNHEFAMSSALGWVPAPDYAEWPKQWVDLYDSHVTFTSYGVEPGDLAALAAAIPASHKDFVAGLPWAVNHPEYIFVHAGLDPNQAIGTQKRILARKDFTLNRPAWLCSKAYTEASPPPDCEQIVVSGHVRVPEVLFRPGRILIDTTGGFEGDLSCVLLPEEEVITSGTHPAATNQRPALSPQGHLPVTPPEEPKLSWWRRVLG